MALESPIFKGMLQNVVQKIKKSAQKAVNEATVASSFEILLYGLLQSIGFDFLPEKEVSVDFIRHIKRGRMDSKLGEVIIEYKHKSKLKTTEEKKAAREQIEEYLESVSLHSMLQYYGFITDGLECLEIIYENGIKVMESNFQDFNAQIAIQLVKKIVISDRTEMSTKNLINDFCSVGDNNNIVYELTKLLFNLLTNEPTDKTKMLLIEWQQLFRLGHNDKSQQATIKKRNLALGEIVMVKFTVDDADGPYRALFALQTTYAILIKIIAYRILSDLRFESQMRDYGSLTKANDVEIRGFCEDLEEGDIFKQLGISNLLEGDFFSWYSTKEQWKSEIADKVRIILQILVRYENSNIFETKKAVDLFKGLYETMIPRTVRSSLGEFYTPVWLSEHILRSVKPEKNWRGLDPCAGSGTFVISMISAILNDLDGESNEVKLSQVLKRVQAIDLNPLAVLTTRINYFIRIAPLIPPRPNHIQIPVYLGDASYVPETVKIDDVVCLKYIIKTVERPIEIIMPKSITLHPQQFSKVMNDFEREIKLKNASKALCVLENNIPLNEKHGSIIPILKKLTEELIELENKKWNGIWARIITNFLSTSNMGKFDIIIGNPPWIDWKNLPSGYRDRIKSLCIERELFSGDGRTGGINLNICALITKVSIDNWLSNNGKLAFLMPKKLAFQQSYDGFRRFKSDKEGRDIVAFYDWSESGDPIESVQEEYMTYVIGKTTAKLKSIPVTVHKLTKGSSIHGKSSFSYEEISKYFTITQKLAGQITKSKSTYTITNNQQDLDTFKIITGDSFYKGREGIEFFPQELFLFMKPENVAVPSKGGCVFVRNLQFNKSLYKLSENTIELEKEFLFPLIKGVNIHKFHIDNSGIVVPFPYNIEYPKKTIPKENLYEKAPNLYQYFIKHEEVIKSQTHYSDKLKGPDPGEFYGFARVGKYSFAQHYVTYRDNTKWGAAVVSNLNVFWGEKKRALFQNHAVSICERKDKKYITEDEAHYICAILNSTIVEKYILASSDVRSFNIRLPIYIPEFDKNKKEHCELSDLSKEAHKVTDSGKLKKIIEKIDINYLEIAKSSNNR